MKTCLNWMSVVAIAGILGVVITTTGCGQSAPPPAPAVEEPPTEDYEAGEAAYQNPN